MAQAIVKYTELEKEYGDFIEGVVPKEEMLEHFDVLLPPGTPMPLALTLTLIGCLQGPQ